jgi:hypothetical protein
MRFALLISWTLLALSPAVAQTTAPTTGANQPRTGPSWRG